MPPQPIGQTMHIHVYAPTFWTTRHPQWISAFTPKTDCVGIITHLTLLSIHRRMDPTLALHRVDLRGDCCLSSVLEVTSRTCRRSIQMKIPAPTTLLHISLIHHSSHLTLPSVWALPRVPLLPQT